MLASFWQEFVNHLGRQKDKTPIVFSLVKQLTPLELTDKKIVLSCDNQGSYFFLKKKLPLLETQLASSSGKKMKVELIVTAKRKRQEPPLLQFAPTIDDVFHKAGLAGRFKFDNFAVSPTNQVAHAASQAVADEPGRGYNPLFLWGGVGVGKTHLAQAIAHKVLENDPQKKVVYCPGDQFTNELVEAIRERTTSRFRRKYRHLDLFVIDDVQFIGGKSAVQEEFFHTFNSIVAHRGQIILTSDKPPAEIKGLEDRLRSRFSGGLTVDIQLPDFELRTAILLLKAKEKNIEVDIEIAKIIAEQISDTRALEGTLLTLYARTIGKKDRIDLEAIETFFEPKTTNGHRRVDPDEIIKTICSYYNIKQSHLKSPNRSDFLAHPRQVAMFILRKELGLKLEEIAYLLKRKDHTTIMHGVEKIEGLVIKDPLFKQEVDRIISSLRPSS